MSWENCMYSFVIASRSLSLTFAHWASSPYISSRYFIVRASFCLSNKGTTDEASNFDSSMKKIGHRFSLCLCGSDYLKIRAIREIRGEPLLLHMHWSEWQDLACGRGISSVVRGNSCLFCGENKPKQLVALR